MSKVFVTQYSPRLQFVEAEDFGEVQFLTDKEYRPEPVPPTVNQTTNKMIMRKLVSEYIPGEDYILLTGSSIPNVVAGMAIAKMPGPHRLLKWSNRMKKYELYII